MTRRATARTSIAMGTFVTIEVVGGSESDPARDAAIERALIWFDRVESCCSRFDPASELMQLTRHVGEPVHASPALFEAVRFALTVAEESGGAFDPAIGAAMEARGFDREHRTRARVSSGIADDRAVSYRDVTVDEEHHTIELRRPLVLDLGGVAKGLAIDLAAQELRPFADFAIDAGGDLYVSGTNREGELWRVGVRDPREETGVSDVLRLSDAAVCTSGDYERRAADGSPHILDPRSRQPARAVVSVTTIAATAMLADAAATAAFVLGPEEGVALLERLDVSGVVISSAFERFATRGLTDPRLSGVVSAAAPHRG